MADKKQRSPQQKNWFFTLSCEDFDNSLPRSLNLPGENFQLKRFIWIKEELDIDNPHTQYRGYLSFKSRLTISKVEEYLPDAVWTVVPKHVTPKMALEQLKSRENIVEVNEQGIFVKSGSKEYVQSIQIREQSVLERERALLEGEAEIQSRKERLAGLYRLLDYEEEESEIKVKKRQREIDDRESSLCEEQDLCEKQRKSFTALKKQYQEKLDDVQEQFHVMCENHKRLDKLIERMEEKKRIFALKKAAFREKKKQFKQSVKSWQNESGKQ